MTIQEFGGGMDYIIDTIFKWLLQIRSSESVIASDDLIIFFCKAR